MRGLTRPRLLAQRKDAGFASTCSNQHLRSLGLAGGKGS